MDWKHRIRKEQQFRDSAYHYITAPIQLISNQDGDESLGQTVLRAMLCRLQETRPRLKERYPEHSGYVKHLYRTIRFLSCKEYVHACFEFTYMLSFALTRPVADVVISRISPYVEV